jgi:hypothetical protein
VVHHPIIGFEHQGKVLTWDAMIQQGLSFAATAKQLLVGRLSLPEEYQRANPYNPVGYKISLAKSNEDTATGRKGAAIDGRMKAQRSKKSRVAS